MHQIFYNIWAPAMILLAFSIFSIAIIGKIAEFIFSYKQLSESRIKRYIRKRGYNAWRNFFIINRLFEETFGKSFNRIIFSGLVCSGFMLVFCFIFYVINLFSIEEILELLFNKQRVHLITNTDDLTVGLLVKVGILSEVVDSYYAFNPFPFLSKLVACLVPLFVYTVSCIILNIVMTRKILTTISRIRKSPIRLSSVVILGSFCNICLEIILIPALIATIYISSSITGYYLSQSMRFDEGKKVEFALGIANGGDASISIGFGSETKTSEKEFVDYDSRDSVLDLFTGVYSVSKWRKITKLTSSGTEVEESYGGSCEQFNISHETCVKKARTLLFDESMARLANVDVGALLFGMVEFYRLARPYVCSITARERINIYFKEQWKQVAIGSFALPFYVFLGMYIIRICFSSLIPLILIFDALVIGGARHIDANSKFGKYQIARKFSYLSVLPVAAAVGAVHFLTQGMC